jgi:hypothetical protein
MREEKDLWIKSETIRGLLLEKAPCSAAMKEFEPTLCITQAQTKDERHDAIEELSAEFSKWRLMLLDVAAIHGARADNNVCPLLNRNFQQFVEFFDWSGKISIRKKHPLAVCVQHSLPDAVAFALVCRISYKLHAGREVPLNDRGRFIP